MRLRALQVSCALLLTAGIIAWLVWPHYLIWSATNALNRLYIQYRPFPYRWIGAGFSAIKVQESTPGCTAIPEDKLAESRLKIRQAELRAGQTAQSLQQFGRIDLLLCMPSEAIKKYKLALLLDPDNPSLNLELGVAFALDASADPQLERQGALDYEGALEGVLRSARQTQSPEILFDSALLFDEAQLPIQAQERWAQAEKLEHSTEWQVEDRTRLAALQRRINERQLRMLNLTNSPDSFLAHGNDTSGDELALGAAIEHWLPEMYDSPASKLALEHLGRMLLSHHHDRWLLDVMKTKPSGEAREAFKTLALAVISNIRGEHVRAADFAHKAESYFLQSHNFAGVLRARIETVYSLDRRSQIPACMAALEGIRSNSANRNYTWIEAQSWMEEITCRTRTRQEDVIKSREDAYDWITSYPKYEGLGLRARGFMTEEYVSADSRLTLWQRGERGLRSFWSEPLPALRGYAFYYTLADSARAAGNRNAAVLLLRESTLLMKEQGHTAIRALLLSYLGVRELEADLPGEAEATFHEMDEEYRNLSSSEFDGFRQESEVIHAAALISTGHATDGLIRLHELTKGMRWPFQGLIPDVRRPLFPALGDAHIRLNQLEDACNSYHQSIADSWEDLQSVQDRAQRDNALREIERAWRGMTAVELKLNHAPQALTIWEEFRSSRNVTNIQALLRIPDCSSNRPSASFPVAGDVNILVYAFLPGGLSGWLVTGTEVEQHWIDEQAVPLASRFSDLVARNDSPVKSISATGQELYRLLLEPFANKLPKQGTLVIDAEKHLASIPWGALEDRPGHALIERFSFCQALGLTEVLAPKRDTSINFSKVLIFGSPILEEKLARQYPDLPGADAEIKKLRHRFPNSLLLEGKDATSDAFRKHAQESNLFHFVGHGISFGGFGALLLAETNGSHSAQYFTANEIADLDLNRMELVVLAACSSAVGEESGVVNLDSLTRAFLEAGAHRVIASNWDVDSASTAELMSAFYDQLAAAATPAEALRQAQLTVRQISPHPYFWAGFRVFGVP